MFCDVFDVHYNYWFKCGFSYKEMPRIFCQSFMLVWSLMLLVVHLVWLLFFGGEESKEEA